MVVARFYCKRCEKTYVLQYLTPDEVRERQRAGYDPAALTCPIGHHDIVIV